MPLFLIFQYFSSLKFGLYQKTIQVWNEENSLFDSCYTLECKLGLHEICMYWISRFSRVKTLSFGGNNLPRMEQSMSPLRESNLSVYQS